MSNRIMNLLAVVRTGIIRDSNGAALLKATEAIELLDTRLDAAEKTIAWLKACKVGGVCRAAPPWDYLTPLEVEEGKGNPDAAA